MTTDLNKPTWVYVARKTLREFSGDQCTDLAAALTYYAVLALFPTAIALLSLVGIFGQGSKTVDTLLRVVSEAGGSSVAQTLRPTLETLSQTPGAGLALILGLLGALWSASGYVGAFGRAMNRIYGIGEGRPAWILRPVMLLVTLVLVVLVAVAVLALIVSGPLTQSLGNALGLGSAAVLAWRLAKEVDPGQPPRFEGSAARGKCNFHGSYRRFVGVRARACNGWICQFGAVLARDRRVGGVRRGGFRGRDQRHRASG